MQDPQIFQHARAHISSITTHIQDNKNTNLEFLTSMNPPAIGNMVVTSPILCIKAQTENPNHYIDISNFLSKKNTLTLTNNAETNQGTQRPRKIQSVSKPIETTGPNDTRERDQGDMPPQESSSETIFDKKAVLYLIN
jgi:hypothetical protein